MEAINNNPGQPILYASTTKGTMKLVVDGHHFRYSFRKGMYSIFQCCYKENKEECNVRVVTDQKLVYPLDGEHVHFIQATDKSVTSIKFTPGQESEIEEIMDAMDASDQNRPETAAEESDVVAESQKQQRVDDSNPVFTAEVLPQPRAINVKLEKGIEQEFTSEIPEEATTTPPPSATMADDANEFREKIKKRLQKALLGKKK